MIVLFRFGSTEYNNPDKQRFPSMAYEIRTNYFGPIKIVGHTTKNETAGQRFHWLVLRPFATS